MVTREQLPEAASSLIGCCIVAMPRAQQQQDECGLCGLETVHDARAKRYMQAAMARDKSKGTRKGSSRGRIEVPQEPSMSDTLQAVLSFKGANRPKQSITAKHQANDLSTTSQHVTTLRRPLPQWNVHSLTSAQLLDMNTVASIPIETQQNTQTASTTRNSCHATQAHSKSRSNRHCKPQPSYRTTSGVTADTAQRLQHATSEQIRLNHILQPPQPLLDQLTEDSSAGVVAAIELACSDGALCMREQKLTQVASQLHRFLLAEGRNLHTLDLAYNQLRHCPPLELLPNLTLLNLSHNHISQIPDTLGVLEKLQTLHLSHNTLPELPGTLGRLKNLVDLDASHNQLILLPPSLSCLSQLRQLQVHHNQLHALPHKLGCLHALQCLSVGHNQLTGLPPDLAGLRQLSTIQADHNLLTAIPDSIGVLHASLTSLHLHNNHLTVLPREIGLLTALSELTLMGNTLVIPPKRIAESGHVQAIRTYLSSYSPAAAMATGNTPTGQPATDQDQTAVGAGQKTTELQHEMEEQGELLLHLQLEQEKLQHKNKELEHQLAVKQHQLHVVDQEAAELRQQLLHLQSNGGCNQDQDACTPAATPSFDDNNERIALYRQAHQSDIEARAARSAASEALAAAADAREQLAGEIQRRQYAERRAEALLPCQREAERLAVQLTAAHERIASLEELVASHLFQQRSAEDRCLEAESRLDALEIGSLSAWRDEVQHLKTKLAEEQSDRLVAEETLVKQCDDAQATVISLQTQLALIQQEMDNLQTAESLVSRIKTQCAKKPASEKQ